ENGVPQPRVGCTAGGLQRLARVLFGKHAGRAGAGLLRGTGSEKGPHSVDRGGAIATPPDVPGHRRWPVDNPAAPGRGAFLEGAGLPELNAHHPFFTGGFAPRPATIVAISI